MDWNTVKIVPGLRYEKGSTHRLICKELYSDKLFTVNLDTGQTTLAPRTEEQLIRDLNRIKAEPVGEFERIPVRYKELYPGLKRGNMLCAKAGTDLWFLLLGNDQFVWKSGTHDEMLAALNTL